MSINTNQICELSNYSISEMSFYNYEVEVLPA